MAAELGLDRREFLAIGHEAQAPDDTFAMTLLALRLSTRANGVSRLHGAVARQMWAKQYPGLQVDAVPITSVTNGVHTPTWVAVSSPYCSTGILAPIGLRSISPRYGSR